MQYILVAFRSRNQTATMYQAFVSNGISAKIVNTPREVNVGCGISIRIDEGQFNLAKMIVERYPQNTCTGFFRVTTNGGGFRVTRLC